MHIAYIDETGDTGHPSQKGSSACYALGCVLISEADWSAALDRWILMRNGFRQTYGVPVRAELKANYLIRGTGSLKKHDVAPGNRRAMYRAHLNILSEVNAQAFSVVVDKERTGVSGAECFNLTWTTLLQRLERFTHYGDHRLMIVHDEGQDDDVRKLVRKSRRHLTSGSLTGEGYNNFPAKNFIDDPSPRSSHHSFMVQIADMVAYAGWRTYMPPSRNIAQVVPGSTWDELGDAVLANVNKRKLNGSVPGVVLRKS